MEQDNGWPFEHEDSCTVADVEKPELRLLREAFEALTAANYTALATFDPHTSQTMLHLPHVTPFDEYERADPTVAEAKRCVMLRTLHLDYEPLDKEHPDFIFEYKYYDKSITQLRYIERPSDGLRLPVQIEVELDDAGEYRISDIHLISHLAAREFAETEQARIGRFVQASRELRMRFNAELITAGNPFFEEDTMLAVIATHDEILELPEYHRETPEA